MNECASDYINRCRKVEGPFFIEAKTNRLTSAKDTYKQILVQYNLSSKEAIAEFRKYTGGDNYYKYEVYNVLESLSPRQ